VTVLADDFSLRERGIERAEMTTGVQEVDGRRAGLIRSCGPTPRPVALRRRTTPERHPDRRDHGRADERPRRPPRCASSPSALRKGLNVNVFRVRGAVSLTMKDQARTPTLSRAPRRGRFTRRPKDLVAALVELGALVAPASRGSTAGCVSTSAAPATGSTASSAAGPARHLQMATEIGKTLVIPTRFERRATCHCSTSRDRVPGTRSRSRTPPFSG
jgi:hypothetical protein